MLNRINLLDATDEQLIKISKNRLLALDIHEMRTIKSYFKRIDHNPTDIELETIAQMWSEHCRHKTLTSKIEYEEIENGKCKKMVFENLLEETIFLATKKINKKECLSVFKDNAGIVEFDKNYAMACKVETHNHPSALEPYGGASTGIGGVVRDILGCGLGAKPIALTDVFCFGEPSKKTDSIFPPARILKGVVNGVRDYGNRIGVPTVSGCVIFDNSYLYNPLVYCGCLGIIPKNKIKKEAQVGDLIVLIGGKTGRDGIHGATFSSDALRKNIPISVVQLGNPIVEKVIIDSLIKARDMGLFNSITDCGAGGISCAVLELVKDKGAKIFLEKVPLKHSPLKFWEIWLSESQERMIVSVPPKNISKFIKIFSNYDSEATVIGEVTNTKFVEIYFKNKLLCKLDLDFIHYGLPKHRKKAVYVFKRNEKPRVFVKNRLEELIEKVISHINIASKEAIITQYDFEVQANTVIKPITVSPNDATVIKPLKDSYKGIAISCGINLYGKISPYSMAASCIDEAIRNLICVGTNYQKIYLLDNFCWGDVKDKYILGDLVKASLTCRDVAIGYSTPFISGKDSLNNFFIKGKTKINISPTLLITSIGIVDDIRDCITSSLKILNNCLYIVGITKPELGGSVLSRIIGYNGGNVPSVSCELGRKIFELVYKAIKRKMIVACHDCSDGGLITTILEMCFGSNYGVEIDISKIPTTGRLNILEKLFSESNTRFIVEVKNNRLKEFEFLMKEVPFAKIGKVISGKYLIINSKNKRILKLSTKTLYERWKNCLSKYI